MIYLNFVIDMSDLMPGMNVKEVGDKIDNIKIIYFSCVLISDEERGDLMESKISLILYKNYLQTSSILVLFLGSFQSEENCASAPHIRVMLKILLPSHFTS
jgi:hypothetical protein